MRPVRSCVAASILAAVAVAGAGLSLLAPAAVATTPCDPPVLSAIACENSKPGNPSTEWDIDGAGDPGIQGFATDMSVNKGTTVRFKVKTAATGYRLDIYRMGYYAGMGARKVATVNPSAPLPQTQPTCIDESSTTGLIDCGNWAESASWAVPAAAVSGIYFARLVRTDTGGDSHIVFVVRDDASTSDALFQTSDTTWQAYNSYGGNSLYQGAPVGRAYKVSYNRPFNSRGFTPESREFVWANEYPMVRWMEANGYDVTYTTGIDSDRRGNLIRQHRVFLSVGHDEYWSGAQRANVEAARDAGVHLAFLSGNSVYWKTRWEASVDGTGTPYRTLVSYKETKANAPIDPLGPSMWTGTWRDPRFSPPGDGGRPENSLMGTMFQVQDSAAIKVPAADGKMRLWRNTSVATLAAGATATLSDDTLGFEWDEDRDNGFRPDGLIRLSTTTENVAEYLLDYGSTVGPATATHHLTMYRAPSGALVFGAGTIQWTWGLDEVHDGPASTADVRMRQATVNLFADMGVQPASLQPGLVSASKSTDTVAPTTTITAPAPGAVIANAGAVTISGTAVDTGGGRVGGVEVSADGGATWHPAVGRETWTYTLSAVGVGAVDLKARTTDDSGNIGAPASIAVTITCPCQIFPSDAQPITPATADPNAVEVGAKIRSDVDAYVTGVRFYKGTGNTGTHVGTLWAASGTRLASATFTGETASGWQQVTFAAPVRIVANTTYVVSYYAPSGHYAADSSYFSVATDSPPLHALKTGTDGPNGVYRYGSGGGFPTESYGATNYWVDVVVATDPGPDTSPPVVTSTVPVANATGVGTTTPVRVTFAEPVQPASVSVVLRRPDASVVPATVAYDAPSMTATLTPSAALVESTTYTATVSGAQDTAGNPMAGAHVWSFTTSGQAGSCPCTIWSDSTVPGTPQVADASAVELGVRFQADVDGYVSGVRFYKGSGNTGSHVGNLWSATGARLATATFAAESTTGWQQVIFATPVAVTANTTYVASYHTSNGNYAADGNYFAAAGVDRSPLHALATGIDGPNGVYLYGAGGFPTQSYNSTNYWVDVLFATSVTPPVTTTTTTSTTTSTTTTSSTTTTTTIPPTTTTTTTVPPTTTTTTSTTLPPRTFTDTSTADFAAGTFGSGASAAASAGGEVALAPTAGSEFGGTSLPSGWTSTVLGAGGTVTVSGGTVTVNGASASGTSTYSRGRSLEFVATFSGAANQSAGLRVDATTNQWAVFGTNAGGALYARSRAGSNATDTALTGVTLGVPHRFRIDWTSSGTVYSVDGVVRAAHTFASSSSLRLYVSDGSTATGTVVLDWMRLTPYASSGTYTSKVFDATTSGPWGTAAWTADRPAGTTVTVSVRTGNTASPGSSWTGWRTLSAPGAAIAATSRYIQYRVVLSTTASAQTPVLSDITLRRAA